MRLDDGEVLLSRIQELAQRWSSEIKTDLSGSSLHCGFIFIAMGYEYLVQAIASAATIKNFSKYPIVLLTNLDGFSDYQSQHVSPFDSVIEIGAPSYNVNRFIRQALYQISPFERTLHLDADTFVLKPIDWGFDLLDYCDVAACLEPHALLRDSALNSLEVNLPTRQRWNPSTLIFSRGHGASDFFSTWNRLFLPSAIRGQKTGEKILDVPSFSGAFMTCQTAKLFTLHPQWNNRVLMQHSFDQAEFGRDPIVWHYKTHRKEPAIRARQILRAVTELYEGFEPGSVDQRMEKTEYDSFLKNHDRKFALRFRQSKSGAELARQIIEHITQAHKHS